MRRALCLAAAAGALWGCASARITPGPHKDGYGVEVQAPTVEQARREAVSGFFDLYLSSPSAVQQTLDEKILKDPSAFIVREKNLDESGRRRFLVDYAKLGRALEAAGLVKPAGVEGKPRVLIALRESGPGGGPAPSGGGGRAADAVRRRLIERGFTALDDSDALNGGLQKTGSREEALADGKKLGAEIVLTGTAAGTPAPDPRLTGYGACRADVEAQAVKLPGLEPAAKLGETSSAVDVGLPAACAKALDSAGVIAADKLADALGALYVERVQFTVLVRDLGNLDRARQLLQAVRGLPRVAAAAFDAAQDSDVRVKIWSDKMGADDMTAELLKLREFKLEVRDVDPSFNEIELGSGAGSGSGDSY